MPALGADMEAGTLVEWHVKPGARVKRGDVIALVETQKGLIEVEIWESGVVGEILVEPGAKVPVGTVLAVIRAEATGGPPAPAPSPPAPGVHAVAPSPPVVVIGRTTNGAAEPSVRAPTRTGVPPRASPAARQLAREHDLDLSSVEGTGPHGAITRADVERAVKPGSGTTPQAETVPSAVQQRAPAPAAQSAMRRAIAAAMAKSKREIPHYYLSTELDVSHAVRWLEGENARRPVTERILFAALLIKATALALREVPELNGFFIDGEPRPSRAIHVGVAISLRQGGLVAPAILDTDQQPLTTIMAKLADLTARARAGSLRSSEMSEPTVTVTSLGEQGADAVFGVIYPPQVALVGFGTVRERPWAEDGMLGVKPIVTASLAADHRVSDGHRGARFLAVVARMLKNPERL